jgi:D-glycero-D-manno-heptose 1,7-bisphosphate phosphatase
MKTQRSLSSHENLVPAGITKSSKKIVVLDRDGVINHDSKDYIKSVREVLPIQGSINAMAELYRAGYAIYVATNQSGIGRGLFSLEDLDAIHAMLIKLVEEKGGAIAGIYYCPHRPEDHCDCRKPKPGLLKQIERHLGHSLSGVPIIGDSVRDLEAGRACSCIPILVKTGIGMRTLNELKRERHPLLRNLRVFDSLADAADALLNDRL